MIVSYYFYRVPEKFLPQRIKPYYSLVARFFSLATLYSIRIKIITRGCVILLLLSGPEENLPSKNSITIPS